MKKISIMLLVVGLLGAARQPIFAQTASEWFDKGFEATDIKLQIEYYTKAIENGYSPLEYAYQNRGVAKKKLKQYRTAIADFDKAIQINPNEAFPYNSRGSSKIELGQYQSAVLDFDKAIQLKSDYASAYSNRGHAKAKLKQYQSAILDFDKAIELNPNEIKSYNDRGCTKYDLRQYEAAILDYDKALQINPNDEIVKKNRLEAIAKRDALLADKTPPTITITDPPINARGLGVSELLLTQIPLRGAVTDASGIQTFQINGKSIPLERNGDFTTTVHLREGDNEFVLQATDTKGNTAEKKIILHRALPPVIEPKPVVKTPEKRLAFVIANSKYLNINALGDCPYHDAEDMTAALQRLGFEVMTFKDLTLEGFEEKVAAFVERLKNYEIGLFFYAGHGLGIDGINYLVPVGFPRRPSKADVRHKCVSLDWIQEKMAEAGAEGKTNIVIADACRDDGGLRNIRGGEPSWEPVRKIPTGFITCYAVPNGQTTLNCNGRNGFYTSVLLQHLEKPKLLLQQVFTLVRADIIRQGGQAPEEADKLTKFIYLKSN